MQLRHCLESRDTMAIVHHYNYSINYVCLLYIRGIFNETYYVYSIWLVLLERFVMVQF
jgi:hypothetical protein